MLKKALAPLLPLALGAGLVGVGVTPPAHAADVYSYYYFTYSGSFDSGFNTAGSLTANGVFTVDDTMGSTITAITDGSFSFSATTLGGASFGGSGTPVLVDPTTCSSDFNCMQFAPDNILSYPTTPYVSPAGFVFSEADATGESFYINIFSGLGSDYPSFAVDLSGDFAGFDGSLTVTPTPLPASLPLLGSVLGGSFFIAKWRRRRKFGDAAAPA